MNLYIPLIITLSRLILSPTLIPFLCVNLLPQESLVLSIFVGIVFAVISLTDFIDGYLARKFKAQTELGAILDHVADKILLISTVISLVAINHMYYFWAIIFITREIYVMTIRQVALTNGFDVKVSWWGKIKTTVQFIYLFWAIINPYHDHNFGFGHYFNNIEIGLLYLALLLTIISAVTYTVVFLKTYKKKTKHDIFRSLQIFSKD